MGIFSFFKSLFADQSSSSYGSDDYSSNESDFSTQINPASGLPMIGNSNIDVGGNVYGTTDHGYSASDIHGMDFNPASGLPMMGDSSIDVAGNAYGTNDSWSSSSGVDDSWHTSSSSSNDWSSSCSSNDSWSTSSGFDDSWSSSSGSDY